MSENIAGLSFGFFILTQNIFDQNHEESYNCKHLLYAICYMQKQINQHNKEEQDWCNIED